jgi:hypothetical protein
MSDAPSISTKQGKPKTKKINPIQRTPWADYSRPRGLQLSIGLILVVTVTVTIAASLIA